MRVQGNDSIFHDTVKMKMCLFPRNTKDNRLNDAVDIKDGQIGIPLLIATETGQTVELSRSPSETTRLLPLTDSIVVTINRHKSPTRAVPKSKEQKASQLFALCDPSRYPTTTTMMCINILVTSLHPYMLTSILRVA